MRDESESESEKAGDENTEFLTEGQDLDLPSMDSESENDKDL